MNGLRRSLCLICLLQTSLLLADNKAVIGWVEPVMILPETILLQAKIDTGADHSSINASKLEKFHRQGSEWVRFQLNDRDGKLHLLEKPVLRNTLIKRRGIESQRRPVIRLGVCLHRQYRTIEVNLADRKSYNYKMLIGRSFLQGLFLVDSALMNRTSPECEAAPPQDS